MVRRNRDAKFVIYQVLYIFVITVLALKGAEINLGEVVDKDDVVEKSVRDSLINVVDSLSLLGLKFNIEVDTNAAAENLILKSKLSKLNTQMASLTNLVKEIPKSEVENKKLILKVEKKLPSPFSTNQTFLKYASNVAKNKGDFPVTIVDPLTNNTLIKIPPKAEKVFELANQNEVILKYGSQEERIVVENNLPPEILIEKVTTKMDKSDIYVKELQRTTCFNVIVKDERLEQIKVTNSGAVSVTGPRKNNKGQLVYNVSLMLATNEDRFNDWVDRNDRSVDSDGRYKTNFFFTAYDTKSKQRIEVGESFYFTDFSK